MKRSKLLRLAAAVLSGLLTLPLILGVGAGETGETGETGGVPKEPKQQRIDWDAFLADEKYVVVGTSGVAAYDPAEDETVLGGDRKLPIALFRADDPEAEPLAYQELTAVFTTSPAYLSTIPADYMCQSYAPETIGVDDFSFVHSQEPGSLGVAEGSYHRRGAMEDGDAYERIHWSLEYSYQIHIVCKSDWPLEYCVASGGQIRRSPDRIDYAMQDREDLENSGWQLYETSLGGRRALVRCRETDDSYVAEKDVLVLSLVDLDNLGIGEVGGATGEDPARRDMRLTRRATTWDYTVLDELPHVPGFYAAICIHVEDRYESQEAVGGSLRPEAGIINNGYYNLVSAVTGTVPAEIAATQMRFAWVGEGEIPFLEQEDITDAQVTPGEDEGTDIDPDLVEGEGGLTPADILLITGGALTAVGTAALLNGGDPEEPEEEEPRRSRYKMYVNKNFDNVLRIGDVPRAVFARIVEIPPGHGEFDRPDLTEKIQVFSGDGVLEVRDGGMSENGYKTALVTVPPDCRFREGEVSFRFTGKGGVYTRHVVFQLTEMQVIFLQPNLGLPANHTETERLPFGILGIPEETMDLKVEFESSVYTVVNVEREPKQKEFPLFYAYIRESKPDKDPKKQKEPGTTETFYLRIEAKSPSPFPGEPELRAEARFPVLRIQMGLSLIMEGDAIGCYLKYKEGHDEQVRIRAVGSELACSLDVNALSGLNAATAMASSGIAGMLNSATGRNYQSSDLEPCVTEGRIMLLDWDPKEHCIIRVAVVPKPEDVSVKATMMLNDRRSAYGEPDEAHQHIVDKLKVMAIPTGKVDERGRLLKFCATEARLDAPTRLRANITLRVKYGKEWYEVTKNVLLHSLPIRSWSSDEEYRQMRKFDDHVAEYLDHVRKEISHKYMYNLFSLHDMIDRMLEGYNERFGYDGNQLDNVMRIWTGFLQGSFKGARGETEKLTLADDLAAAYAFLQGMRDNGGLLGRIALGVCTAGYSEYVFFAMDLGEKMKEAVFACKGGDSEFGFWDAVVMGVKEYEKQLLIEFMVVGGAKLGSAAANIDLAATLSNAGAKYRAAVDAMDEALKKQSKLYRIGDGAMKRINRFFNRSAGACSEALKREQQLNRAAKEKADTIANRRQGSSQWTAEELQLHNDYDRAMKEGMSKVKKLMEAQKELAMARQTGNYWEVKAKYEAAARDVWLDKNALKTLKKLDHPYATNMRAEFNAYRNRVKQRTTEKLLDDIALETGKRREDLFIQSATSNDAIEELAGHKVPEDWDVTVREHVSADPKTVSGKPVDGVYDVMPTALDPKQQVVMKQTASKNALARNLYKEMYGVEAPSLEKALENMRSADVSYVSPWGDQGYVIEPNLEAYADLAGMIDKSQIGRDLKALALNRATFAYKGNEWYRDADAFLAEALKRELKLSQTLDAQAQKALKNEIRILRDKAQACYVEGTRQITKQVTKIADPRNSYRVARGGVDMFSPQAREIHALALKVGDTMSPAEFFHILRSDYGIDKYAYTEMMSKCLI